ncbi:MAG: DNA cytosine methyltransferase [Elioraea sp.]|nr:DNA cytosine methyltransferase [Elioraea sp.]
MPPPLFGEIRIVDLFSGVGGFAVGAAMAAEALGFLPRLVAAVDVDTDALEVHRRNLGTERTVAANMREVVRFAIRGPDDAAAFEERPVVVSQPLARLSAPDVVIAGPPCEGHSNLNNTSRRDDPRNGLILCAASFAVAVGARALVVENVRQIIHDRRGNFASTMALLRNSGWAVEQAILNAADFGAPQSRERIFLVAFRDGGHIDVFRDFVARVKTGPLTVGDALEDLLECDRRDAFDTPPTPTPENRRRIDHLFERGLHDLPCDMRPPCHRNGTSYKAVYGRLWWDRPAPTVTTGFGTPGRGRFIHPLRPRLVTPHEAARLQTFPDWFDFRDERGCCPPRKSLEKWIGDAVPPVLGFAVVLATLAALDNRVCR